MKKALTKNKDNLGSTYADLEMYETSQKLVEAVCERASADMDKQWMSFMEISNIMLTDVGTY